MTNQLHPAAHIDPAAVLGQNIRVGPGAVIEAGAVIGDGCTIEAHAVIRAHTTLGRENYIGHGAILGGDPQDLAFSPATVSHVRIGDRNRIREYVTIHRGTAPESETVVGDDCFLMANAHLAHNVRLGNHVVIANAALLAGHVQIADRVFIGGACVFHQFVRVGTLAICQGTAGFGKDLPPFCIGAEINGVAGLNVIGLRRAGFTAELRAEVKEAFRLLYRAGLNVSQAAAAAAERPWSAQVAPFWQFVGEAKKRGLCDFLGTRPGAAGIAHDE